MQVIQNNQVDIKELLADMEDEGITVSVIALGSRADSDSPFLIDIANRGRGRIFH